MKQLRTLFILVALVVFGSCEVSHSVWGRKFEKTTVPTVETTTEFDNLMNIDLDNDNPTDTHILGAPTPEDASTTEGTTIPSTTTPITTTTPTTTTTVSTTEAVTDAREEVVASQPPSTTTTVKTTLPPVETPKFPYLQKPPPGPRNPPPMSLLDIVVDPDTSSSEEPDATTTVKPSGCASGCDCSNGCSNDSNCQDSPCGRCGGINFHSVNNGGNFTFNADFRKGCKESSTGCN